MELNLHNFDGGTTKIRRGKSLNSKLSGKRVFLAVHPSTMAGQCFSRVSTGGRCYSGWAI